MLATCIVIFNSAHCAVLRSCSPDAAAVLTAHAPSMPIPSKRGFTAQRRFLVCLRRWASRQARRRHGSFVQRVLLSLLILLAYLAAAPAYAGCSSPTGNEADRIYNQPSHTLQFCDSANWVSSMGMVWYLEAAGLAAQIPQATKPIKSIIRVTTLGNSATARIGLRSAKHWCLAAAGLAAQIPQATKPIKSTIASFTLGSFAMARNGSPQIRIHMLAPATSSQVQPRGTGCVAIAPPWRRPAHKRQSISGSRIG